MQGPGADHLRQDLGPPRDHGPGREPAREPGPHRRQPGLPALPLQGALLRRRTLLRRLREQPGIRPGLPQDRLRGRGRRARALRDQRRPPDPRGRRRGQGREKGPAPGETRHPLPQRRGAGRGQLPGGRAPGRLPGPGYHQRLRRTLRQRQPLLHHPEPGAQDGLQLHRGGAAQTAHSHRALRERDGQPAAVFAPALRGRLGLRPQGRHPRARRAQGLPHLRARGARGRGQQAARAPLGPGRPQQHHVQGPPLRLRPGQGRPGRAGPPGRAQEPRGQGLRLLRGRGQLRDPLLQDHGLVQALLPAPELPRAGRHGAGRRALFRGTVMLKVRGGVEHTAATGRGR